MRSHIRLLLFFFIVCNLCLPQPIKRTNWQDAGYRGTKPVFSLTANVLNFGADNTGASSVNTAVNAAITSLGGAPGVIYFPAGTYLFTGTVAVNRDSLLFKGDGHEQTVFLFNMSGTLNNCFNVFGSFAAADTTSLLQNAIRDSNKVTVNNSSPFNADTWVYLTMNDSDLLYSTWAYGSVGQIMQVGSKTANVLQLKSPFRYNYPVARHAKIKRIIPRNNIGFECLKIQRLDATSFQTSLIAFDKAVNCWVNGIEGDSTNYSHIELSRSSNIEITNSYFHHAHAYGGGGKGYGITFQYSSGECKAEGNIFMHLRHSLLMQAGANGNVCAYNFSFDPFWNESFFPSNAAGELVLHGNFVFSNLFEGNICQNIVIDDSHAANGPYNTFFRNRASLYGFVMNNNPATDTVQIIANEITNGFYSINGNGHLQHANNVQGNIVPNGTNSVSDTSLYLLNGSKPLCMNTGYNWPAIGFPAAYNTGTNEAFQRYSSGITAQCTCSDLSSSIEELNFGRIFIFPNPASSKIYLSGIKDDCRKVFIFDLNGRIIKRTSRYEKGIDIADLLPGIYFLKADNSGPAFKFVKID